MGAVSGTTTLEPVRFAPDAPLREAPLPQPPERRSAVAAGRPSSSGLRESLRQALETRRLFVLLPFALIGGVLASLLPTSEPHPFALFATAAVPLMALALALVRGWGFGASLLAACFALGFTLLPLHGALSGTPMLGRVAYGTYTARVDQVLSRSEEGLRLIVSGVTAEGEGGPLQVRRARLFLRGSGEVAPGDLVRAPIRFYPVPGPVLPGAFDAQFNGYFDGIGAYGTVTGPLEVVARGADGDFGRLVDGVRDAIAVRIDRHLPAPSGGIARAIINGDQSAVPDAARDVMATAGLAHVLSISGLHLTLVAGGVFAALRLGLSFIPALGRFVPVKPAAAAGGIAAALAYFAISGGNVAATRSTLMIVLVFGAVIVGRRALTMRNVAIAAIVVIFLDPASVFGPSFQLSFAAVTALVGAFELSRREPRPARGILEHAVRYIAGLGATSLVAGAATVLFSAYHFQQTSPLGVLGNLVSLPLVGFVTMPAALMGVVLMPFGLEGPFLSAMGWSIDRMLDLATLVAGLSAGIGGRPLLTPIGLLIGFAALGWFAFLANRWRLVAPALAVPMVLLLAIDRPPDVLIADTTRAVALRETEGLRLATGEPGSFAATVWEETYGDDLLGSTSVRCDGLGCIATGAAGFRIAIVADPAGFFEDCGEVDLVVTRRFAPAACRAATAVVDAGDLRAGGAHWLAWNAGEERFEMRPAITDRHRAWRILPR